MPGEIVSHRRKFIEHALAEVEKLPPGQSVDMGKFRSLVFDGADLKAGQFEMMLGTIHSLQMGLSRLVITLFRKELLSLDEAADILERY